MTKILKFPNMALRPIRVRTGRSHDVSIYVLDRMRPEEARWRAQFAVARAASFRALLGFSDAAAAAGRWHKFEVGKTFRIRRFLRDVEELVTGGRLMVKIDGRTVRADSEGERARLVI